MQPRFGLRGKNQPLGKEKQSDSLRKMSRGKSKLWPHHAQVGRSYHFQQIDTQEPKMRTNDIA